MISAEGEEQMLLNFFAIYKPRRTVSTSYLHRRSDREGQEEAMEQRKEEEEEEFLRGNVLSSSFKYKVRGY